MIVYAIAIALFMLGIVLYDLMKLQPLRNVWLVVEWLVLVLVAGLRYHVGGDTFNYEGWYEVLPTLSDAINEDYWTNNYMPLWNILGMLCKTICDKFVFFQIVHAIIVNTIVVYFFNKHTPKVFTAILLYALFFYLLMNTETLRASLSVCMFLLGYGCLKNRQWLLYALCCGLGIGFHLEASIMLLFPLCIFCKNPKPIIYSVFACVCLLFLLADNMLASIIASFNSNIIVDMFNTLIERYANPAISLNIKGLIVYVVHVGICIYWLYLFKDQKSEIRFFLLLALFIEILTPKYNVLVTRMTDFTHLIIILWIIEMLQSKTIPHPIINKAVILFSCCIMYFSFYFSHIGDGHFYQLYLPYTNQITQEDNLEREMLYIEYHESVEYD